MNEGWATFWHYTLLNHLYDEGLLADSFMLEFLQSHTNVVAQPPYNSRWFGGINPYALGFAMWRDIRRICEDPTRKTGAGSPRSPAATGWNLRLRDAQLQDELRRAIPVAEGDARLPPVRGARRRPRGQARGLRDPRRCRLPQAARDPLRPVQPRRARAQRAGLERRPARRPLAHLRHNPFRRRPLGEGTDEVMRHLARLWGFTVRLERAGDDGKVELVHEIRGETTRPARPAERLSPCCAPTRTDVAWGRQRRRATRVAPDHPTARPPCSRLARIGRIAAEGRRIATPPPESIMFSPLRPIYPVAGIREIEDKLIPNARPPLMERAGRAAAQDAVRLIMDRPGPILVACGPATMVATAS